MKIISYGSSLCRKKRSPLRFVRGIGMAVALLVTSLTVESLFSDPSATVAKAAGPESIDKNKRSPDSVAVNPPVNFDFVEDLLESGKKPSGSKMPVSRAYPTPNLEPVNLVFRAGGTPSLQSIPKFRSQLQGRVAGITDRNHYVLYTLDPELQKYAQELVDKADVPHVAIVAMDPNTGRILAMAGKSKTVNNFIMHNGMPAASLFKVITAAAAIEKDDIKPNSMIPFHGGIYTLNKWNYAPDRKKDTRLMSVAEAMGKSCNPVFGRIALKYLSPDILRRYVNNFGFNAPLSSEFPMNHSTAFIPESDFELSRTAAGFGNVKISPVHAAALMAGVANGGILPRPRLVSQVMTQNGDVIYQARPEGVKRIVSLDTSRTLMRMMLSTTTIGTSRKEFVVNKKQVLPVQVAAKTGTLSGNDPKGLNQWFIAAAPMDKAKIALSVITVNPNPGNSKTKASRLGRMMIQKYLN